MELVLEKKEKKMKEINLEDKPVEEVKVSKKVKVETQLDDDDLLLI